MCPYGGGSRPLLLALCCSVLLLAAGFSWAEAPYQGTLPQQGLPQQSSGQPRPTQPGTEPYLEGALNILVGDSAELTKASEQHYLSTEAFGRRLSTLESELGSLKMDYEQLWNMYGSVTSSSDRADSLATEAILDGGRALVSTARSRDFWKTATKVVVGALALSLGALLVR